MSQPREQRRRRRQRERRRNQTAEGRATRPLPPHAIRQLMQGSRYAGEGIYVPGDLEVAITYKPPPANAPLKLLLRKLQQYVDAWRRDQYVVPSTWSPLGKHYTSLTVLVDDIIQRIAPAIYKAAVPQTSHAKTFEEAVGSLRALTWAWHRRLHQRALVRLEEREHELCFTLSWSNLVRLYGVPGAYDRRVVAKYLDRRLGDFAFPQRVGVGRVVVYNKALRHMTLSEYFRTLHIFYGISHKFAYSNDMYHYMRALLLAASQIFAFQKPADTHFFASREFGETLDAEAQDKETTRIQENENLANQIQTPPLQSVDRQTGAVRRLRKQVYYDVELLGFAFLDRMDLARELKTVTVPPPDAPAPPQRLLVTMQRQVALCLDIAGAIKGMVKKQIYEEFYGQMFSCHMYHGERVRYVRRYGPGATDDTILQTLRAAEFNRVNEHAEAPVTTFLSKFRAVWKEYCQSLLGLDPDGGLTTSALLRLEQDRTDLEFERPFVLAVMITLIKLLRGAGIDVTPLLNWEATEDLALIRDNLSYAREHKQPIFVRHMRMHFVLMPPALGPSIQTPFLTEALEAWFAAMRAGAFLRMDALPHHFARECDRLRQ